MSKISVFDFKDYKPYLEKVLDERSKEEKGQRSRLSEAIGCNTAYISQVLNGTAHLSPEQAQSANSFLGHTPSEAKYFLTMVLYARAGTRDLQTFFDQELKTLQRERFKLRSRMQYKRTLSEPDQARYYSSWIYAAVHVIVSLPGFSTPEKIAKALGVPSAQVAEALEFLAQIGVLKIGKSGYSQGEVNLYIGSDSPFIVKHHTNWRVQAIRSLDRLNDDDLHYSGIITCSEADSLKVREILKDAVGKIRTLVQNSKDENMYAYDLDFYSLLSEAEHKSS